MDMNGCFLTAEWPFHVEHCKATFWPRHIWHMDKAFFKHRYAEVARFAQIHPVGQRRYLYTWTYTYICSIHTYICSIHSHMTCTVNYLHRTRENRCTWQFHSQSTPAPIACHLFLILKAMWHEHSGLFWPWPFPMAEGPTKHTHPIAKALEGPWSEVWWDWGAHNRKRTSVSEGTRWSPAGDRENPHGIPACQALLARPEYQAEQRWDQCDSVQCIHIGIGKQEEWH